MNEEDEERLSKAAMKSLIVPAPESLKADLKRMARSRRPGPTLWDRLRRFAEGESAWAYGAGAAFAAAGIGVLILRAVPERAPVKRALAVEAPAAQSLSDLWSDDAGEDSDEL